MFAIILRCFLKCNDALLLGSVLPPVPLLQALPGNSSRNLCMVKATQPLPSPLSPSLRRRRRGQMSSRPNEQDSGARASQPDPLLGTVHASHVQTTHTILCQQPPALSSAWQTPTCPQGPLQAPPPPGSHPKLPPVAPPWRSSCSSGWNPCP